VGICLMCQAAAKLTNEHIIPRWASRLIREVSPNDAPRGSVPGVQAVGQRLGVEPRRNPGDIDCVVKGLCNRCNSAQDEGARPPLHALILGDETTLDEHQQAAVATWVYGKALAADLLDPAPELGEVGWAMRSFRHKRHPAQQAQIWLATFDPTSVWPESAARVTYGEIALRHAVGSWTILAMGRVLFTTVRWRHEALANFEIPDVVFPLALRRQVWPVSNRSLVWPLPEATTYSDVIQLETWGGAAPPAARRSLVGLTPPRRRGSQGNSTSGYVRTRLL
jgi:hypothetical protein